MPDLPPRRLAVVLPCVFLLLVGVLGAVSVGLGSDADYDMRNYHLYAGYALLHKPVGYDLAPAQLQSYFAPFVDVLFYEVVGRLNDHPAAVLFIWAIPSAIAAFLVFLLGLALLEGRAWTRVGLAAAACAIGASGATALSTTGIAMSEAVPNCLLLAGLLLALRRPHRAFAAGALFGVAAAAKLTTACYAVGLGAATLLRPGVRPWPRLWRAALCGMGILAGLLAVVWPWWLEVWKAFGNPLFPLYNGVFRSPLYLPVNFFDDRFLPHGLLDAVLRPFRWAVRAGTETSEEPLRDPRIALALLAAAFTLLSGLLRRGRAEPGAGLPFLSVWFLASFAVWERMFSIARYAACLELVSGVLVLGALQRLVPRPAPAALAAALLAVLLPFTTAYPNWNRIPVKYIRQVVQVEPPPLSPDSLVVILDGAPESYLAMFYPASVRWVGVNNNWVHLDSQFGFQDLIVRTLRTHPGPLWGLEKTDINPGWADASLHRYGLRRRAACAPVPNVLDLNLRICPLERTDGPG